MKKYDVIALGELLIDFTNNGKSEQGNDLFEANPGGAPCNVLSMLTTLGRKTAFIGKVGNDMFGTSLKKQIEEIGIDTTGLKQDPEVRTTLAFIKNDETGDRTFSFYRNPGADMMLKEEEIPLEMLEETKVFHFGTLSMTHEECRVATIKAVEYAKEKNAIISFDPNIRESLWNNMEDAWQQVHYGLTKCDILKISDNEIVWFTGEKDYDKAITYLKEHYQIPLILLSMGPEGSSAYWNNNKVEVPAFLQEATIETTGAGDTFGGCCISALMEKNISTINIEEMESILRFANAAASIITTRRGALKVMPKKEEIEAFLTTSCV